MFPRTVEFLLLLSAAATSVLADAQFKRSSESNSKSNSKGVNFIEPDVRQYSNVLPPEVCRKIIELGETAGFAMDHDSIDEQEKSDTENNSSQAIDVMDEGGQVNQPAIYEQLKPYIPKIAKLIMSQRDEEIDRTLFPDDPHPRIPELGWVFYRKYSPDSPRNSLVPHFDDNMHTVNIALNDDFTGGGLFYVKPTVEINPDFHPDAEYDLFRGEDGDGIANLDPYQYTYEWVHSLTRGNTPGVVFPKLRTGDALIHNYTVWHAVAPLDTGIRYSMVLFFDMHNPMIKSKNPDEDEEEYDEEDEDNIDDDDDDGVFIRLRHNLRECDPTTGKLIYIKDNIDILYVNEEEDNELSVLEADLRPGQTDIRFKSYHGHEFRAIRSVKKGEPEQPLIDAEVLATVVVDGDTNGYEDLYEFAFDHPSAVDCEKISNTMGRKVSKKEL